MFLLGDIAMFPSILPPVEKDVTYEVEAAVPFRQMVTDIAWSMMSVPVARKVQTLKKPNTQLRV